ncbi:MAG: hypothetical protein KGJ89_00990 [Patescibacteria group bacterium]|nr:hypothetical protein [Patescibacteria group bacterium]
MLPLNGTAHSIDVVLEIAERNKELVNLRTVCFIYKSNGMTQSESERKYSLLDVSKKDTVKEELLLLRDNCALSVSTVVGLCSVARHKNGEAMYLPQLDFSIPISDDAIGILRQEFGTVMSRSKSDLVLPGYIIASGRSYHYLGLNAMRHEEWLEFLGLSLLFEDGDDQNKFSPVDRRWIGHSLVRGFSTLRIFGGAKGNNELRPEPVVVDYLE